MKVEVEKSNKGKESLEDTTLEVVAAWLNALL